MTVSNDDIPVIAIGWDVRGWRSKKQAVAVLELDVHNNINWLGVSGLFQLEPGQPLGLSSLLSPAIGNETSSLDLKNSKVVIGIDAPLAFPKMLVKLLQFDNKFEYSPPDREIDNHLAYRDCERWIFDQFSKKPLSAAFDKLGNNTTLAMCVVQGLKSDGFQLAPQEVEDADHVVIEVYPGIAKCGLKKVDRAIASIERHIPGHLHPGTDQYDAAICAILAATFAGKGVSLELPDLVGPPVSFDTSDGWIYGLPAEFVRAGYKK